MLTFKTEFIGAYGQGKNGVSGLLFPLFREGRDLMKLDIFKTLGNVPVHPPLGNVSIPGWTNAEDFFKAEQIIK